MNETYCGGASNGLRGARERKGMNQEALASLLGVTDGAVSHWETGRSAPGQPTRRLIALFLNVSKEEVDSWFAPETERGAA